ncbi:MAG: PqqD family protein [Trueperaceae bacterium]|nr:PqqD family protein [Trueperaceae bacterium]
MATPARIATDTTLTISSDAVSTSTPGETVILDPASGKYFGLDGVGTRVWELLQTAPTYGTVVATIVDEYDVDADTCERDVRALLVDLRDRGLVRFEGESA